MTILAGRSAGIAVLTCIPFRSAIIVFYVVVNLETSFVLNGSVAPLPLTMEPVAFEHRLFNKPQMAAYFDVEIRTLESWMKEGILPFIKIGRNVRFRGADILAMLDARRRGKRGLGRMDFD